MDFCSLLLLFRCDFRNNLLLMNRNHSKLVIYVFREYHCVCRREDIDDQLNHHRTHNKSLYRHLEMVLEIFDKLGCHFHRF